MPSISRPPSAHSRLSRSRLVVLGALLLLGLLGARWWFLDPQPRPTRGVIVISLDTLRADHVGAYGYARNTTPFLDSLAARGVLFERAVVQYNSTLTSHMSLFTGLYPQQHAVYPPDGVLSHRISTLPELFTAAGYRTAGFVEDGLVKGSHGFARGFGTWTDDVGEDLPVQIETTFERGLTFLRGLEAGERFFLFLHTYAIHDPYEPPEPYRTRFWKERIPAGVFPTTGRRLKSFNDGPRPLSPEVVRWMVSQYDGSILYADSVVERFFADLEALGLADDVTVVVTSDHGEEFLEHGRLAHAQVYDEVMHVPLLVLHPDLEGGRRVPELVESLSLFRTILDLAGIEVPEGRAGETLTPFLTRRKSPIRRADPPPREGFGETGGQRTFYRQHGGETLQAVVTDVPKQFTYRLRFDADPGIHMPELRADGWARDVTIRIDDEEPERKRVGSAWTPWVIDAGEGRRRVDLVSGGCPDTPAENEVFVPCPPLTLSSGLPLRRLELFRVDGGDGGSATADLAYEREGELRGMLRALLGRTWEPVAAPLTRTLDPEERERLRALGYL